MVSVRSSLPAGSGSATPRTLYDKVWDAHVVKSYDDGDCLLYIDRHLVQEVSSPQAFAGLAAANRPLRRPSAHIAVADHAVPTQGRERPLPEGLASRQVSRLAQNADRFGVSYIRMQDQRHGIVHVIGPELGFTLPGVTLVCGDSHTSTHGAFGAVAFGIGSSEVECALATQTLRQRKQKRMRVNLNGTPGAGITIKDIVLALIARVGAAGGVGYAIEYAGSTTTALSMEARMTLCNMTIEAGSRIGMVAPDETTFAYVKGRALAPAGAAWEQAMAYWRGLASDPGAVFDKEITLDAADVAPHVSWGTTPEESAAVDALIPDPAAEVDPSRRARMQRSLDYMNLKPGMKLAGLPVDRVFIGSCTNGRIEDLRLAASIARGRKVAANVAGIVVPGSASVRRLAEAEGLDRIFREAGFEWRESGCSMCVAMNDDRLNPGERCASTSNRNFEGRQGQGGRTHLMSPAMAAAAAVVGCIVDVRGL
jgi:3-isopropylmalate/(R)-2-methylmalate dehydratase large subunit